METTNDERQLKAFIGILSIYEHIFRSLRDFSEIAAGGFLSAGVARYVIAERCEETAKLIGEKL